jgi:hypothetical protein
LPARVRNVLTAAGLKTVGEVREISDEIQDFAQGSLAYLRDTPAECASVLTIPSSTLAAAWLSGTLAENGSATTNWRLAAVSAAIGKIAISGYSPRSLRCASNRWPSSCYVAALKRSDRLARSISIVEILLDLANEIVLPWSRFNAS